MVPKHGHTKHVMLCFFIILQFTKRHIAVKNNTHRILAFQLVDLWFLTNHTSSTNTNIQIQRENDICIEQ